MSKEKKTLAVILVIIAVIIVVICIILGVFNSSGGAVKNKGSLVGTAIGSYEGSKAGKAEGLSAEDTTVNVISNQFGSGKLEVLKAEVHLNYTHNIGENDYFALYANKATAIWYVDLSKIEIDDVNGRITIPSPICELIDEKELEKIYDAQKFSFSGSSKDGAIAYVNSLNEASKKSEQEMQKDTEMIKPATDLAIKRIQTLADGLSVGNKNYKVVCESNTETKEDSKNE